MVEDHPLRRFYEDPGVAAEIPQIEARVERGELAATQAALDLLALYERGRDRQD